MKSRPRSKFVLQLKARRCPNCGAKVNNQVKRSKPPLGPPPLAHPILARHRDKNQASRDLWQTFAEHRRRVADLLIEAAGDASEPHLTVLGAGNCTDLDLSRL